MIPEKSMSMRPMLHFICYKMVFFFFVRSNVVWNTVRVNMAFCKPTDGGFSRNIERRKGKTISSIYMSFPVRTKSCSFNDGSDSV